MDSSRSLACAAVLLGTVWLTAHVAELPVWAVPDAHAGPPSRLALANGPITLGQAVRLVQERYRAKVVRSQTVQEDGHTVYVLRVLSDSGHVWTVRVDAASGSIH
jgi:uncharacterized membrane protein YkoI